jgi:hypothetical protein
VVSGNDSFLDEIAIRVFQDSTYAYNAPNTANKKKTAKRNGFSSIANHTAKTMLKTYNIFYILSFFDPQTYFWGFAIIYSRWRREITPRRSPLRAQKEQGVLEKLPFLQFIEDAFLCECSLVYITQALLV